MCAMQVAGRGRPAPEAGIQERSYSGVHQLVSSSRLVSLSSAGPTTVATTTRGLKRMRMQCRPDDRTRLRVGNLQPDQEPAFLCALCPAAYRYRTLATWNMHMDMHMRLSDGIKYVHVLSVHVLDLSESLF